ncbi:hypothetical protein TNCV_686091 [Trichonephila clavipes]|nr:hypothetical protein TNCV_686091 [Trichonephila clavipes]
MEYRLSKYSPTERKVDDREGQCNVWYNGNCKGGFYTSLQLAFRSIMVLMINHPSSQWETSRPTNGESSSPVTDRIPSLHFPSQRLVKSSLAYWPGNPRPLVERVTPNDPRSHDDPE